MSDNVIPIFGEEQEPKKPSLKKQWIIFFAIVAMIVLLLVWFLLSGSTSLDGVKRFFRYLGTDDNAYRSVSFDTYGNYRFALVEDTLAVASQGGLNMFSPSGRNLQSISGSMSNPLFDTADDLLLLYDVGGTRLMLFDEDGDVRFDLATEGIIFDADLCEEGYCAVLYEGSDCCAVLDVYNSKGAKLYTHRSGTIFLNTCALSPDGTYAIVTTLGQEDISFLSTARILTTRSEGIKANVSFGTQVICDVAFLDNENICAIGEESLFFFDVDGNLAKEFMGENAQLSNYCFGEDYVLVVYDNYDLTSGFDLYCLNSEGKTTASANKLSAAPQDLSICGNYICLMTAEKVLIYDTDLTLRNSFKNDTYLSVLARDDGTALCVGGGYAELYIP